MKKYIILLRAVNVSGKNILKMAELKNTLSEYGFQDVQTYIQSGNILVETDLTRNETQKKIQNCIATEFGLNIEVFVFTKKEFEDAKKNNPYSDKEPNRVFFTFMNSKPDMEKIEQLATISFENEYYSIHNNILYFYLPSGAAKAKMSNSFFEQKLKIKSTGRNMNTIDKLILTCK